ncbi:MAG TPA: ATP-dependent helicase HrpB, partial [Alphaproteobacteria bacterium]|nr:ATP-dependent helicase HrpB [Alphaproteobacteria bacterium]
RFEPRSGMTRLVTVRASQASSDQRRGRAGRQGPGVCYRLWSAASHGGLPLFAAPEIREADLTPLALDLAQWGVGDPSAMAWLDPPPAAAFAQARTLLRELGALDAAGRITDHGRAMAELGLHPRLAHMVLTAMARGLGGLACDVAALLEERDILKSRDGDLRLRVEALRALRDRRPVPPELDRAAAQRALAAARQLRSRLDGAAGGEPAETGLVVAFAYPDRIARRRPGGERSYLLSNGRGAWFPEPEPLSAADWLAVADLDGERRQARIFAAAPLSRIDLEAHFADLIETDSFVRWETRERAVLARRQARLGALVLKDEALEDPDPDGVAAALLDGVRQEGLAILPWTKEAERFRARVAFLRRVEGEVWPDLSDGALLEGLEDWLLPWIGGMSRAAHLARLDIRAALEAQLGWEERQTLDSRAPTHVTVPSGSRVPVDYEGAETPVLAVRLQEMFGLAETPRVAGRRVPLTLHLLSPAHRPVQVTQDLGGFWASSYRSVKADLKGRYPKHHWPDDPLSAEPTARAKPRKG